MPIAEGFVYDETTNQPVNGSLMVLCREDTGAVLGTKVSGAGGEPNSKLHLPLESGFNDVSTTGANGTAVGGLAINSTWQVAGLNTAQFNASGKRITIPSNPAFAIGTGDFTLDVSFFWPSDTFSQSGVQGLFDMGNGGLLLRVDNGTFYPMINNQYIGHAYTPVLNQANYIRLKRTSGAVEIFYNGVKAGATWNNAQSQAAINAADIVIGRAHATDSYRFHGGLSHLRLVVGEALSGNGQLAPLPFGVGAPGFYSISTAYTGPVFVQELPAGAASNYAPSNLHLPLEINASDVSLQNLGAFTNVGSVTFDGAKATFNGSNKLERTGVSGFPAIGTGDFTFDASVRLPTAQTGWGAIFSYGGSNLGILVDTAGSGVIVYAGGSFTQITGTVPTGAEFYIRVKRSAGNVSVFINGAQIGSSQALTNSIPSPATLQVGVMGAGNSVRNGTTIRHVRLVAGAALSGNGSSPPLATSAQASRIHRSVLS